MVKDMTPPHASSEYGDSVPADGVFVFVNDSFSLSESVAKASDVDTKYIPSQASITSSCAGPEPGTSRIGGNRAGRRDEHKPPRPQNAFMIYRREKHPIVVAGQKNLHNKEVSQIVGRLWRGESEEVHRAYERKADFAKLEHKAKYPWYKYAPRKTAKKKPKQRKTREQCEKSGDGNGPSGGCGGSSSSGSGCGGGGSGSGTNDNEFVVDSTSMFPVSEWDLQNFGLGPLGPLAPFPEGLQGIAASDNILAYVDQFAIPPSDCLGDTFKFEEYLGYDFVDSQPAFFSTFPRAI